jgi:hypothetical protein
MFAQLRSRALGLFLFVVFFNKLFRVELRRLL